MLQHEFRQLFKSHSLVFWWTLKTKNITMRKKFLALAVISTLIFAGCNENKKTGAVTDIKTDEVVLQGGQSAVKDDASQKNVVQVAIGSPDHTTLVKGVQAAELVNALSNAGPFTVFAPTNEAFSKLPAGTMENLLKPENKEALSDILEYHVSLGVYKAEALQDGQVLGQVNGGNITITNKDGKIMIGNATVIASIPASNGIIHVIDNVLLPPAKK
jgi:uncharacterized surface protein with fasciclin (FAS1) repeats